MMRDHAEALLMSTDQVGAHVDQQVSLKLWSIFGADST